MDKVQLGWLLAAIIGSAWIVGSAIDRLGKKLDRIFELLTNKNSNE